MTRRREGMPRLTDCDSIDYGAPRRGKAPGITMRINRTINASIIWPFVWTARDRKKQPDPRIDN